MNHETISGIVTDLKVIPTRTGRSMVTFTVSGKKCKSFGDVADACAPLEGKEAKIHAKEGSFRGEKEFAVISVEATVNGQEVSAKDIRQVPARKFVPPTEPAREGMVRWHVRPGERERFRSVIVKYGTARMLEIFDKLPHPDCSQEQWSELMKEYCDKEKADAEVLRAHARRLGYTDEEIADYAAYTAGAFGWGASKASVISGLEGRRQLYGPRGTRSRLCEHFGGNVTPEVREPAEKPASETRTLSEEERQEVGEKMIAWWVKSFTNSFLHPDSDLEKELASPRSHEWTREAARRVLETRRARRIPAEGLGHIAAGTFEDLENEYKALKAARESEKANQQGSSLRDQTEE